MSFKYNLPPTSESQQLPYDGLSDKARYALAGISLKQNPANYLDLGLDQSKQYPERPDGWMRYEISKNLERWNKYPDELIGTVPMHYKDLCNEHRNFEYTMNRLHAARSAMKTANLRAYFQEDLGNTKAFSKSMEIQLIPWQAMRDNYEQFFEWLDDMRKPTEMTGINLDYAEEILSSKDMYLDTSTQEYHSATEYLDMKLAQDGPWGIMLTNPMRFPAPYEYDKTTKNHDNLLSSNLLTELKFDDFNVDSLGVFEWIAMILQTHPTRAANQEPSLLMPNRRIGDNHKFLLIPTAYMDEKKMDFEFTYYPANQPISTSIRWAVM